MKAIAMIGHLDSLRSHSETMAVVHDNAVVEYYSVNTTDLDAAYIHTVLTGQRWFGRVEYRSFDSAIDRLRQIATTIKVLP